MDEVRSLRYVEQEAGRRGAMHPSAACIHSIYQASIRSIHQAPTCCLGAAHHAAPAACRRLTAPLSRSCSLECGHMIARGGRSRRWGRHAAEQSKGRAKQGLGDLEKGGKRRGQNHSVADASAFLLPCAPDHVLLCVFQDNGQHVSHGEKRGQHREAGSGSEQRAAAGWAGCRSRAASDQQRCLRCRQARRHRGQAWGTEGERDQRE